MCTSNFTYWQKNKSFEYFREHTNDHDTGEVRSLTENIFCKQVRLIRSLQESAFSAKEYQDFRTALAMIKTHLLQMGIRKTLIAGRFN